MFRPPTDLKFVGVIRKNILQRSPDAGAIPGQ
ncbi:hypothetical protein OOU_Y34scaffold01036g5 [Pyricularia oryzae Y34]|uniref:Uncharacterized protein n=3 Tax=Pyricularia oryzae TaxID=318829 RepID=A0A4P7NJ16_PYROR|nr:hypothetical protein OOU_Y34scaffold01036g5 [Pyricularia oryzae Y34]QBZ61956.1 hypothetical protein PoMZ_10829 [Pyricularia oryzae]